MLILYGFPFPNNLLKFCLLILYFNLIVICQENGNKTLNNYKNNKKIFPQKYKNY
uniref:Uncharacterized protein n=1 Tax=Meloidogyne enterolobii TaxID=390850 RepID=A0A6V7V7K9_MELEN|nr:unnamed protein product [Meloidogyne enterolobii]